MIPVLCTPSERQTVEAELRPLVDTERTHPAGSNERIEDKSHGEYQTEHHSNGLRCAPFTH
jgi:hypothetical protein